MATRKKLKLRELRKILNSFGVGDSTDRGKGGHILFSANIKGQQVSFPVPGAKEVLDCYVNGCRRKFELTTTDGISDKDFYSRA